MLRPGTPADVPGIRAVGEAVVPPTYGPIDEAYAQRMLDEWWAHERLSAHGCAEVERHPGPPWPDDVWMRKRLGGRG